MSECKWKKVAIVNVADEIGKALVDCFLQHGAEVLAIDETRNLAELPSGVAAIGLQHNLNDVNTGEALLQGMRRWGTPDLLVNNFSTGFLSSPEENKPNWNWGAQPAVIRSLSATAAYATLRKETGNGEVLNIGVGRGLIPEGCPMHFSLLGVVRSLSLAHIEGLKVSNVCLHNVSGLRAECVPCTEEVLHAALDTNPENVAEMVCDALKSLCDKY